LSDLEIPSNYQIARGAPHPSSQDDPEYEIQPSLEKAFLHPHRRQSEEEVGIKLQPQDKDKEEEVINTTTRPNDAVIIKKNNNNKKTEKQECWNQRRHCLRPSIITRRG
jgi:hypothetical protein